MSSGSKSSSSTNSRGTPPVNLQRLAEYLNLSPTTISLVLNNSPAGRHLPEATKQRVIQAAEKLQYRPNYFARSIRSRQSKSVGILAPSVGDGYFTLVMSGVEQVLVKSNYFSFVASHYWRADLLRDYPRLLLDRSVDGFLLLNTELESDFAVPVVAISAHKRVDGTTNIALDHHAAALLALRHLCELGHKEIAFMKGPACVVDSIYRWDGIQSAAHQLGVKIRKQLSVPLEESSSSPASGYAPTAQLLTRRTERKVEQFTALFCFNDITAMGAMRAIHDQGLSCPADISVIGFDDILAAEYQLPSLTTIRQPLERMGSLGAKLLLDRIAQPNSPPPDDVLVEPELIVRESTSHSA